MNKPSVDLACLVLCLHDDPAHHMHADLDITIACSGSCTVGNGLMNVTRRC